MKQSAEEVGHGIISRDQGDPITYSVGDPAMHILDGGPSIAERIAKATDGRVILQRADNRRVGSRGQLGGWDVVRSWLKGQGEDGRPMLYVFSTYENLIRTLPGLQHDPNRPEDVDTEGEDHAPDMARYACMSRPWISDPDPETKWNDWLAELLRPKTLNEMLEQYDDERAEEEG